ncbi:MAG: hypothetical protein JWP00_87 [Chloroflexi bacterium]|jgi:hypothetical protein|nr:hypothetical protein [Chloroflexota bacterium]
MPALFVNESKIWKIPALGLCALLLSALLVACGGTPDTNYTLYEPTSLTAVPEVASNPDFRNAVLSPKRTNEIVEQDIKVYRSGQALADLQSSYTSEMTKRGWLNVTPSILRNDELGQKGVVMAFEKPLPDASKKRIIGIILLSPDVNNPMLDTYRANGTLPKDQNVVIAVQGGTGPVPAPNTNPA